MSNLDFIKNWDAGHYIDLAKNGYVNHGDAANFIVFQPFYPFLLHLWGSVFGFSNLSILTANSIIALLGLIFFYLLLKKEFNKKIAISSLLLFLLFPTSFFLFMPYAEGLFLLMFSLSFYFAKKNNYPLASLCAALGTLTRPSGILLAPSLAIEVRKDVKKLAVLLLPTIMAFLFYLNLNHQLFGNYFQYLTIQKVHWYRSFDFPWSGILKSYQRFLGGGWDYRIWVGLIEALTATIGWILIPFAWKKLTKSMATFYTLSIILITSFSFVLSTPRYLLSIPPLFALLAQLINKKAFSGWLVLSLEGLIIVFLRFHSGNWAF